MAFSSFLVDETEKFHHHSKERVNIDWDGDLCKFVFQNAARRTRSEI